MKHLYPLLLFLFCFPFVLYAQSGPAGITALHDEDLIIWLKPGEGLVDSSGYVKSWRSVATYYYDSSDSLSGLLLKQDDASGRPHYSSGNKGRGSYLEFDGAHDYLQSADLDSIYEGDLSVAVVARYADAGFNHSAITSAHPDSPDYAWQIAHKGGKIRLYNGFSTGETNATFMDVADTSWHIFYFHNDGSEVSLFVDGEKISVFSSPSIEMRKIYCLKLGKNRYNTTRFYGDIAEMMVFGKALSEMERLRLFNNLSAYYDITLPFEDYFDEGAVSYYGANVIGIGSYNTELNTYVEGSLGLTIDGAEGIEDGEMLFIGQNTLSTAATDSNFPASLSTRMLPVFSVQESGHIGEVRIEFDESALNTSLGGDLKLVVSTDTFFTDYDAIYPMGLSGGKYGANIDFASNSTSYMVVASDLTALPLDLISFQCEQGGAGNLLEWSVLNDEREAIFTEVQRKVGSKDWRTLNMREDLCEGYCTFEYLDADPLQVSPLYRLKFIEANGSFFYSPVHQVRLARSISQKMAYPNPNNGTLHFYGKETGDLKLFNSRGETVVQKKLRQEDRFVLDELKEGLYFLHIESDNGAVRRQRLFVRKD